MSILDFDTKALLQVITPFIQSYRIDRTDVVRYNQHGRASIAETSHEVSGYISKRSNKTISTDLYGKGRRISESYFIVCVVPEYISIGDIIYHPIYGRLKVTAVSDGRDKGAMVGELTRTTTSTTSTGSNNKLYEPD